ncbi:MAG: PD-(D/E)XK motif protein [Ruminococcus sp.]|nr:PD-(D/E)XK motif protein [Ruminococcus sp.]
MTLEYLLRKGIGARWQGAEGGVQDVQTEGCNYEVKSTTSRYGYEVTINSIYQLKNKGADLKLVFCRFEKASVGTDLNTIISGLISLGYPEVLLEKDFLALLILSFRNIELLFL